MPHHTAPLASLARARHVITPSPLDAGYSQNVAFPRSAGYSRNHRLSPSAGYSTISTLSAGYHPEIITRLDTCDILTVGQQVADPRGRDDMPGTLTVHTTRYTIDEITEYDETGAPVGLLDPPYDDEHTSSETHSGISASDAARIIKNLGLSFTASGGSWASNPDGSYTSDYSTGEETEQSAHLSGFPERVESAIIDAVDGCDPNP